MGLVHDVPKKGVVYAFLGFVFRTRAEQVLAVEHLRVSQKLGQFTGRECGFGILQPTLQRDEGFRRRVPTRRCHQAFRRQWHVAKGAFPVLCVGLQFHAQLVEVPAGLAAAGGVGIRAVEQSDALGVLKESVKVVGIDGLAFVGKGQAQVRSHAPWDPTQVPPGGWKHAFVGPHHQHGLKVQQPRFQQAHDLEAGQRLAQQIKRFLAEKGLEQGANGAPVGV